MATDFFHLVSKQCMVFTFPLGSIPKNHLYFAFHFFLSFGPSLYIVSYPLRLAKRQEETADKRNIFG